ncbi:MAG: sporulation-like protein [Olavius algarvensis Delta 4 endosymbiont]|nr:MAG: sporulation-like protein [Olavius algarvensis Delta 4 endosymbiont]
MRLLLLVVLLLPLWPQPLFAVSVGKVEGLQAPAWVQWQGVTLPVMVGMAIKPGDRLFTGKSARLLLRMEEGSLVKLGENASFTVASWSAPPKKRDVYKGFLKVLRGAFRFTTTALSKRHRRAIDVQVASAVAGIRGTDLWGKASPTRDIVLLIEGKVTITRGADEPVILDEPLTFYEAPKNKAALPVAKVDPEQLKKWAAETELTPGQGILSSDGRWVVSLASVRNLTAITDRLHVLNKDGYPAEIETVNLDGETWHRLVIKGVSSKREATSLIERMQEVALFKDAWQYYQK